MEVDPLKERRLLGQLRVDLRFVRDCARDKQAHKGRHQDQPSTRWIQSTSPFQRRNRQHACSQQERRKRFRVGSTNKRHGKTLSDQTIIHVSDTVPTIQDLVRVLAGNSTANGK
jgi:hypothetical protein